MSTRTFRKQLFASIALGLLSSAAIAMSSVNVQTPTATQGILAEARTVVLDHETRLDGTLTANIDGDLYSYPGSMGHEDPSLYPGRKIFYISRGAPDRDTKIAFIGLLNEGEHFQSGHYRLGHGPEVSGFINAAYAEYKYDVPGFTTIIGFDIRDGWIDLNFSADRTRIDGSFEFTATSEDYGVHVVRTGTFSVPNVDMPTK